MSDCSCLGDYISGWQGDGCYVSVTIKDLEINPYVLSPSDTVEVIDIGIVLYESLFFNWSEVRSIKCGGKK